MTIAGRALLLATSLLGLAAPPVHAACSLGAVAVLPLDVTHGGLITPVEINGKTANLILDTGAFATTLTRQAADRLGVRLNQLDVDNYGIGGTQHAYHGIARRMRVGGIDADGMVLGGSDIAGLSPDSGADGLFGMNMMAAYDIDLDLAGHHAILFQADGDCRSPAVALAQPLYDVPLVDIANNRQADVDIIINGKMVRAVIDSGAGRTTMFRSMAQRLDVDLSPLHAQNHREGGGLGPRKVAVMMHAFETVSIGNLTIHNMPIEILDQADMGMTVLHTGSRLPDRNDRQTGGEDMLLGVDFMRKVHLWISHSSQRLIMQYPPQPSTLPK